MAAAALLPRGQLLMSGEIDYRFVRRKLPRMNNGLLAGFGMPGGLAGVERGRIGYPLAPLENAL
jgi:hypothetical protein